MAGPPVGRYVGLEHSAAGEPPASVAQREVGNQQERLADCAHGITVLRDILKG